jgi:tRNA (cmo5U34)-methyltransferase
VSEDPPKAGRQPEGHSSEDPPKAGRQPEGHSGEDPPKAGRQPEGHSGEDPPKAGRQPEGHSTDNTTAHAASDYEVEVERTIPFHAEILRTAIDVVLAVNESPRAWLDTGCGPGKLVEMARSLVPHTTFWMADPSDAMLAIARPRHPTIAPERILTTSSEELPDRAHFGGRLDAITAVQCHHYGDAHARERAVVRCRELLDDSGVLVVFENVRAETDEGHALQRKRWAAWQRRMGRDEVAVEKHLDREGKAFFPIRVSEHLALLSRVGFRPELVWRAYGQAGFLCVAV